MQISPEKKNDIFLIFASKHRLWVLKSTHKLCFGSKIGKVGIRLHTPVLLYKSGVSGGIDFLMNNST